ncbi:MAG TPA: sigma-E factor regulatory protein RseB domain-containing protein [Catenuloplanes sp.]
MSTMTSRPALRWLVPAAAAVAVIGGGAAIGTLSANAEPTLPERSAAQLLVDLQTARLDGLSGTVLQQADLGLPALAGLAAGAGPGGSELSSLIAGSHTLRVWYAGPDQARVALKGTNGETDLIRNGKDLWLWNSRDNTAKHTVLSGDRADGTPQPLPSGLPSGLPSTPQEAADAALKAINPSTEVSTGRAAKVAGRNAYELVLTPRDTNSLVSGIRLAIDAEQHVPLRVEVFAKGVQEAAIRVAFTQVDFARPDAEQFAFKPPRGAKVTEESAERQAKPGDAPKPAPQRDGKKGDAAGNGNGPDASKRAVVGEGWTTVLVQKVGNVGDLTGKPADGVPPEAAEAAGQATALLEQLPKVSGAWGSGRLLTSKLFSALLTDDGRVLIGAVTPQRLYDVAATPAGK